MESVRKIVRKIIRENILFERIIDVNSNVDLIYNDFFRRDIDKVQTSGIVKYEYFEKNITDTSILTGEDCVRAHKLNPCKIIINYGANYYQPHNKIISISLNQNAINWALEYNGVIKDAQKEIDYKDARDIFPLEFSEVKIKGTIEHELQHWLDDTLNNRHITKKLIKVMDSGNKEFKGININSTKMEIQAQIGNIKQAKRKNEDIWNDISFNDLAKMVPTIGIIYGDLPIEYRNKWVRDLKTRMWREGLLGLNMI